MSDATKGFLILCAVLLAVGACVGPSVLNGAKELVFGKVTQGEEISMVQPTGWWFTRDAQNAQEVNVPNSTANLNNGQSRVWNAQATAIVEESARANQEQYKAGNVNGLFFGGLLGTICGGIGLLVGIFLLAMLLSKVGGPV